MTQPRREIAQFATAYAKPAFDHSAKVSAQVLNWGTSNPRLAIVGAFGVAAVAAPGLVTSPLLWAIGFAKCIRAGSIATAIHSFLGNAVAGGAFATCTSAGANGAGLGLANGFAQVFGAIMAFGTAVIAWINGRP